MTTGITGITVMGWTAPRAASMCHDGRCHEPIRGKPSMGKSIKNLSSVTVVGLDIAKNVFQLHGLDAEGFLVVAKPVRRGQLLRFFASLPRCLVGMEACSSGRHWARSLIELGHDVKLIPPAYVKPYVRRNKNDAVDAAALLAKRSVGRPCASCRFAASRTRPS
jgi:transposase